MKTRKYCFACDLKDEPDTIEEYKRYHAPGGVWPEILSNIKAAGILHLDIYLTGNRLFMIMEVDETFDFDRKAQMDADNPKVQEWETLMWRFQQQLPWAQAGEKWVRMEKIFELERGEPG